MSTLVKTLKSRLTDDVIYPITKADACYMANSTATTAETQINNLKNNVNLLVNKIPLNTFSSSAGTIVGNYVTGYGCNCFIPLSGASDYTITISSVAVYGTSGDIKSQCSVTARYKTGFVMNISGDYSGKFISVTYSASPIN